MHECPGHQTPIKRVVGKIQAMGIAGPKFQRKGHTVDSPLGLSNQCRAFIQTHDAAGPADPSCQKMGVVTETTADVEHMPALLRIEKLDEL